MNITSSQLARPLVASPRPTGQTSDVSSESLSLPTDSVTFAGVGETMAGAGLMATMGALTIGGPAAMILGSAKNLYLGHDFAGVLLGMGAMVMVPTGIAAIAHAVTMNGQSSSKTGIAIFGSGAALATAGAAWAMFG